MTTKPKPMTNRWGPASAPGGPRLPPRSLEVLKPIEADLEIQLQDTRDEIARARIAELTAMQPLERRRVYWLRAIMAERDLTPATLAQLCGLAQKAGPTAIRDMLDGRRLVRVTEALLTAGLEVDLDYWVQPIPVGVENSERIEAGRYEYVMTNGATVTIRKDTQFGEPLHWEFVTADGRISPGHRTADGSIASAYRTRKIAVDAFIAEQAEV